MYCHFIKLSIFGEVVLKSWQLIKIKIVQSLMLLSPNLQIAADHVYTCKVTLGWFSMGLLEISRITWQVGNRGSAGTHRIANVDGTFASTQEMAYGTVLCCLWCSEIFRSLRCSLAKYEVEIRLMKWNMKKSVCITDYRWNVLFWDIWQRFTPNVPKGNTLTRGPQTLFYQRSQAKAMKCFPHSQSWSGVVEQTTRTSGYDVGC